MRRVLFCLTLGWLGLAAFPAHAECGKGDWQAVREVFDGDTIQLKSEEKVRFIGIDAPETHENEKLEKDLRRTHLRRSVLTSEGNRSYHVMKQLVGKGPVRLEYDQIRKDKYGRTLAYVYACLPENQFLKIVQAPPSIKGSKAIKEFELNREMVRYGWAEAFRNFRYREKSDYFALEAEAKAENRGLWAK